MLAQCDHIRSEYARASNLAREQSNLLAGQYNTDTSGDSQWWATLSHKRDSRLTLSSSLTADGCRATEGLVQRINVLQNEQNQLQQSMADVRTRLYQAQTTLTDALLTDRQGIMRDEMKEISSLFENAQISRDRLIH